MHCVPTRARSHQHSRNLSAMLASLASAVTLAALACLLRVNYADAALSFPTQFSATMTTVAHQVDTVS